MPNQNQLIICHYIIINIIIHAITGNACETQPGSYCTTSCLDLPWQLNGLSLPKAYSLSDVSMETCQPNHSWSRWSKSTTLIFQSKVQRKNFTCIPYSNGSWPAHHRASSHPKLHHHELVALRKRGVHLVGSHMFTVHGLICHACNPSSSSTFNMVQWCPMSHAKNTSIDPI